MIKDRKESNDDRENNHGFATRYSVYMEKYKYKCIYTDCCPGPYFLLSLTKNTAKSRTKISMGKQCGTLAKNHFTRQYYRQK